MSSIGMGCFEGTSLVTEGSTAWSKNKAMAGLVTAQLLTKRLLYAKNIDLRGGRGERKDAADGSTKFQGRFGTHDNMHPSTLCLHELSCSG
jgi:hypothetical protein